MTPFREDVLVSEDVIFWATNSIKVKGRFHLQDVATAKSWYMRRIVPNSLSRVPDEAKFIRERENCIRELDKILEGDCDVRLVQAHKNSQLRHVEMAKERLGSK